MLLAYLFVPLCGAAIIPVLKKVWSRGITSLTVLITLFQIIISVWIAFQNMVVGNNLHLNQWLLGQIFPLKIDGLAIVILLAIGLVSLVTAVFSYRYPLTEEQGPGFYALLLLAITGMNGMVMATDLFTLYIFLEIVSIAAFILIAFRYDELGMEASFKYMMLSAVATIFLLLGLAILFSITGSVSYAELKAGIATGGPLLRYSMAFIFFAFALKAGMMPFHAWLPDAYTASSAPVSIFLAGIITKVAGVYTLMRLVLDVFGFSKPFSMLFLIIGAISTVFGAFMALGQKDFKRVLAFSSISQIGYIIMGFATGTTLGLIGAVFHFFNHSVFKSLLFLNAGAVESATGTRQLDELGGLSNRMPVTGITSVIGLLSTAGIPPLAGFWSKVIIIIALWTSGNHFFSIIATFASIITLAYLLSIQRSAFFGKIKPGLEGVKEVSPAFYWPAILMAALTIICGVFFPMVFNKLLAPVDALMNLIVK